MMADFVGCMPVFPEFLPMISSILQPTTMVADDRDLSTAIKSQRAGDMFSMKYRIGIYKLIMKKY